MIPNQWYVVLDSSQVKDRPIGVTRLGEKLVFWRDSAGKVHCARDKCAHRGAALGRGKVLGDHIQCPFHGFEYAADGRAVVLPALGRNTPAPERFRLHTYPTYEAHGFIWMWWGENHSDDLQPPRFFDDLDDSFTYGQVRDPWNAHYSRVIENQLDPIHLPFVHHNTIGRGCRTIVDGPVIRWIADDMFYVYVSSRVDDGIPPRKPEELEIREGQVYLEFIFPNLWQNHISEDVRVVAAFVPVDEEHTILYLRFYQRFMRIPVLRELVNWLAMPFNRFVAHQDRRVVETQEPKVSALRGGEQLIQGDRPVVEYRRRRQELIDQQRSMRA